MTDVIEEEHFIGFSRIDLSGTAREKRIVNLFVEVGEMQGTECTKKISREELFERGAMIVGAQLKVADQFALAAWRGENEKQRAADRHIVAYNDTFFVNGTVQAFVGTKKEHEAAVDARINNRNLFPRVSFELIASFGGGAGEPNKGGSVNTGVEYAHGAPLEPISVTERSSTGPPVERVHELDPQAANYRDLNPTIRLQTEEGTDLYTRGPTKNLTRRQRAALPEETIVRMQREKTSVPRNERVHPDLRILVHAALSGFRPLVLTVAGQPFCSSCAQMIAAFGGMIISPNKAVFNAPTKR